MPRNLQNRNWTKLWILHIHFMFSKPVYSSSTYVHVSSFLVHWGLYLVSFLRVFDSSSLCALHLCHVCCTPCLFLMLLDLVTLTYIFAWEIKICPLLYSLLIKFFQRIRIIISWVLWIHLYFCLNVSMYGLRCVVISWLRYLRQTYFLSYCDRTWAVRLTAGSITSDRVTKPGHY